MILCWEGTCELHFMSGMEKILQSGHFLLSQFKVWTWNRIFCCKFCLFKDNPYFKAIISVGCLCDKNVWWWVGQLNHALLLSNYSKHHFIWPTESILNLPMAFEGKYLVRHMTDWSWYWTPIHIPTTDTNIFPQTFKIISNIVLIIGLKKYILIKIWWILHYQLFIIVSHQPLV